jgi:hypothetical protein
MAFAWIVKQSLGYRGVAVFSDNQLEPPFYPQGECVSNHYDHWAFWAFRNANATLDLNYEGLFICTGCDTGVSIPI